MNKLIFTSNGMKALEKSIAMLMQNSATSLVDKTYVGWGLKASGQRAEQQAAKKGSSFALVEDGFLRCVKRNDPPLSLVFDNQGIYYDAGRASRIERLIPSRLTQAEIDRTQSIAQTWRELRLSKYNEAREYQGELPRSYVLVLDQTFGDCSIDKGLASAESFKKMLNAAIQENPNTPVILKIHPDIYTKNKQAHYDIEELSELENVIIIAENCHPVKLIENSDKVYTVTSQVGFEALLWGKPVRCFGMPFYAGWGLTEDELEAPARRNASIELSQLIHAALVAYPQYIDPETGNECEIERVMEYIGSQRITRERYSSCIYAMGFSRWKQPILRSFLAGSKIAFVNDVGFISENATVVLWGNNTPVGLPKGVKCLRIEDGFLRSAGLGAELIKPLSWVIDEEGLYYDASKPSALEALLQTESLDESAMARAKSLRENIVSLGISKYNLSGKSWERPNIDKNIVLVPGQVESDLSIKFGSADIKKNIDLLRAVRNARPDAYIVYKPHPDVVAGLRDAGEQEDSAQHWCDEIVTTADAVQMLAQVDEVHTLTSLTGFEALMRGVCVTCYGNPFYAGWGLTNDMFPLERRNRKLTLDALVHAVLISYPTYVSNTTNAFTSVERIVAELKQMKERRLVKKSFLNRLRRKSLRFFRVVRAKK